MNPILRHAVRAAILLSAATAASSAAAADCDAVVAAYRKAEATKRYAVYEVDRIDRAPAGAPFSVSIDGTSWVRSYAADGSTGGWQKSGHLAAGEADALASREKSGRARCASLGDRKIGMITASGWRIGDGPKDPAAIDFWIDRATGLPVFHGMGSDNAGLRWAYGADVVAPK